jgi:iron complex outermembrane receptor protein
LWKPELNYFEPVNIKKVWSRGYEVNGLLQYQMSGLLGRLKAGYTYSRSTNEEKTSDLDNAYKKQLIYIPEHRFFADLSIGVKGFLVTYSHQYTGIRYTSADNQDLLPAFTLADLSFSKTFYIGRHQLTAGAEILNIWDTEYQTTQYYPMPGRNFRVNVIYKFDNQL